MVHPGILTYETQTACKIAVHVQMCTNLGSSSIV